MYAIYRQLHPYTGIDNTTWCHFFDDDRKNLLVSSVNRLDVYQVTHDPRDSSEASEEHTSDSRKLEMVTSFSVFANIDSIGSFRMHGHARDSVMLASKDAKISVVQYDPETHDLKTMSMHYFEDELHREGQISNPFSPVIRVDPLNRCAAVLLYGNRVVILPFVSSSMDQLQPSGDKATAVHTATSAFDSFIIDVRKTEPAHNHVHDLVWLHGCHEPTLALLVEPRRTWAGRVALRADTCNVVALSVSISDRLHPMIWNVSGLPYDCHTISSVHGHVGGCLVTATNSIIYLSQSSIPVAIGTNVLSENLTLFPLKNSVAATAGGDAPPSASSLPPGCSLEGARLCQSSEDRFILSLKNGDLYSLTLIVDAMKIVRDIRMIRAASLVTASSIQLLDPFDMIFIGSRLANSYLLSYTDVSSDLDTGNDKTFVTEPPPAKKAKPLTLFSGVGDESELDALLDLDNGFTNGDLPEDAKATGGVDPAIVTRSRAHVFHVLDSLINIGPCVKASVNERVDVSPELLQSTAAASQPEDGEVAPTAEELVENATSDPRTSLEHTKFLDLTVTAGKDSSGAIISLNRTVTPTVVTSFELPPDFCDIWTVIAPKYRPYLETDAENGTDQNESWEPSTMHSFMLLSRVDSSSVFETGSVVQEIDTGAFNTLLPTLLCENWPLSENCTTGGEIVSVPHAIVQVTSHTVHLIDGNVPLAQKLTFSEIKLSRACLDSSRLILVTSRGALIGVTFHPNPDYDGTSQATDDDAAPTAFPFVFYQQLIDVTLMDVPMGCDTPSANREPIRTLAVSLFTDCSGLFAVKLDDESDQDDLFMDTSAHLVARTTSQQQTKPRLSSTVAPMGALGLTAEDEDELLYGSKSKIDETAHARDDMNEEVDNDASSGPKKSKPKLNPWYFPREKPSSVDVNEEDRVLAECRQFLFVITDDGTLGVFSMTKFGSHDNRFPDANNIEGVPVTRASLDCVFRVEKFNFGPMVLAHTPLLHETVRERIASKKTAKDDWTVGLKKSSDNEEMDQTVPKDPTPPVVPNPATQTTAGSGFSPTTVFQILAIGLGSRSQRPFILAHVGHDVFIYEAYPFAAAPFRTLKVRFSKHSHSLTTLEISSIRKKRGAGLIDGAGGTSPAAQHSTSIFRRFTGPPNRSGDSDFGAQGVFVCGANPAWIFVGPKGTLRIQPFNAMGPLKSFAYFHNITCPHGFLTYRLTETGSDLHMASLPSESFTFDAAWPFRRVPVRKTVHFMTYVPSSGVIAFVTSHRRENKEVFMWDDDDNKEIALDRLPGFPWPGVKAYELSMLSADGLQVIPDTDFLFESWEVVCCLIAGKLRTQSSADVRDPKQASTAANNPNAPRSEFVIIGTNFNYTEDSLTRGRIILLSVTDVVPEPGRPLTRYKLKPYLLHEEKGPVTCAACVDGFLLTVVGQRIFMWCIRDQALWPLAFLDTQIFVLGAVALKDFVLIADLHKSISLYRFKNSGRITDNRRVLSIVTRDLTRQPTLTQSAEYLVDSSIVTFILADVRANLFILAFQPELKDSLGGTKLMVRGDFHTTSVINHMFRVRCRLGHLSNDKRIIAQYSNRHVTFGVTLDGGVVAFLPLRENTFRRLSMLYSLLCNSLSSTPGHIAMSGADVGTGGVPQIGASGGGFNPRQFRACDAQARVLERSPYNAQRNIIDGQLLIKFIGLPHLKRVEIARKVGTTVENLIADIQEIEHVICHF